MGSLITLSREGQSRIEIKQSVFIGRAIPVSDSDEANAFVAAQRQTYPDARHTVYAWKTSGDVNMQKYSDDGEPAGTAGMPVLSILEHNGITNAAVAVTRYFGGILLGKGGLVRAYTECAKLALSEGIPVRMTEGIRLGITVPYGYSDKVSFELKSLPAEITDTVYLQDVKYVVDTGLDASEEVMKRITDITGGIAVFDKMGEVMIKGDQILL